MMIPGRLRTWVVAVTLAGAAGAAAVSSSLIGCDRTVRMPVSREPQINYEQIERGLGPEATEGRMVHVHYVGRLPSGEIFLDTRDKSSPHRWVVGQGAVIEGIDRAVLGMRPGGVRVVKIPPELHWGRAGYAGIVPENATLEFELTLVAVN